MNRKERRHCVRLFKTNIFATRLVNAIALAYQVDGDLVYMLYKLDRSYRSKNMNRKELIMCIYNHVLKMDDDLREFLIRDFTSEDMYDDLRLAFKKYAILL